MNTGVNLGRSVAAMKVYLVSSSRAEYGFLTCLADAIGKQTDIDCSFVLSGLHVDPRTEHISDRSKISTIKHILTNNVVPVSESQTYVAEYLAASTNEFARLFAKGSVDLVVLLGDRIETMGAALAAHSLRVPIAHLHGGEVTLGLLDDGYRNAISKLSSLHFPTTETHRENLVGLGEQPERIFNVGALAVEAVGRTDLLSVKQLESLFDMSIDKLLVVTFHPVTLARDQGLAELEELLNALESLTDFQIVFTSPNLDGAIEVFRQRIKEFLLRNGMRARLFESLGHRQYLSALNAAVACVGNSSSGLIEAPILGVPTVDIGLRQTGRFKPSSVTSIPAESKLILAAIQKFWRDRRDSGTRRAKENVFGAGDTSDRITQTIREHHLSSSLSKWSSIQKS
jgi:UDP-N-acetylglucosamine 2-epimerase (non-hydrolysing)/GDP/UDP-N,N'-diacetylbacillosamine 2-epimerase (hydrolysing)